MPSRFTINPQVNNQTLTLPSLPGLEQSSVGIEQTQGKPDITDLPFIKDIKETIPRRIEAFKTGGLPKLGGQLTKEFLAKSPEEKVLGFIGGGLRSTKGMPSQPLRPKAPKSQLQQNVSGQTGGIKPPLIPPESSSLTPPLPPEGDAVNRITQALKEAKPIRRQQERIFTKERGEKMARALAVGEKTTGEAGFFRELGQLKGEMTKVQFESVRSKVGQIDVDELFNQIKNSQVLNFWDTISARGALSKALKGSVPTERELVLLGRVFPKEFVDTILSKRDLFTRFAEASYQLANIPRSVLSSFDFSAPFRQGLFLISHPKRFFGAFPGMFRAFGSEKTFKEIQEGIIRKPTFDLMQESRLALTEMDRILTRREERFMSQWAEKIPIVGRFVRASGRAYVGFLNKLRADVFEDLITKADKLGLTPRSNPDLVKEIANFVNVASGRGSLGALERSSILLNSFFFSPRLIASRLTLLNPVYYVNANPFVRKEALKSLFTVAGLGSTVLGMAKLAEAEVGINPRSSDFGKIKIGNTRIDIWGGFQQYVRMAAQLITGKYVSSTTGKEITLGEGYKPLTRFDILQRQIESKEAPVFSFITDLLKQQDYAGQPVKLTTLIGERFKPMVLGDIIDLIKDDPSLVPLSVLGVFGFGVQTYQPRLKTDLGGLKDFLPTNIGLPGLGGQNNLPKLPGL